MSESVGRDAPEPPKKLWTPALRTKERVALTHSTALFSTASMRFIAKAQCE